MKTQALDPAGAVGAHVARYFTGAEREPDERRVMQVEFGQQHVEIGGERVEVIAAGRAGWSGRSPGGHR